MFKLIGCFLAWAISSYFLTVIIDHPVCGEICGVLCGEMFVSTEICPTPWANKCTWFTPSLIRMSSRLAGTHTTTLTIEKA